MPDMETRHTKGRLKVTDFTLEKVGVSSKTKATENADGSHGARRRISTRKRRSGLADIVDIDGRSLVVAAATHEYNPGEQHTSSRTTKVMVKVVTTEVTLTTRLVPRMVDSRKRLEVELGTPCPRAEVARWSAEQSH